MGGDQRVDGAEFLSKFFEEGRKEKLRIRRRHKIQDARIHEQQELIKHRQIEKFAKQVEAKIIWPKPEALAVPKIKNPAKLSAAKARRLGCVSPQTIGFLEQLEQEERKISK